MLKKEKVSVTSRKKKASVRKDTVAIRATIPKVVRINQNTLPPHLPNHPCHEVEVCWGRDVSEAKVTVGPFFDNRADIIWRVPARERLVNIGIRPSANSWKKWNGLKGWRQVSVSALQGWWRTKSKAEKEQHPKKKRKQRQECCGYCEKCITIGLCITRFRCTRFSRQKVTGKPDADSLGNNSNGTIHQVDATSCEYPGKKGPSLGKINVKDPHQRSSYAVKFEDRSHEETERQQRCARSKAWTLAKNMYKLKEKDKAAFYFPAEEWALPGKSTKEPEESWFRSEYAYGQ